MEYARRPRCRDAEAYAGLLRRLVDVRIRSAPAAVRPRFGEAGEVRRVHPLDLEAALGEQSWDVPCQGQARVHPMLNGLPPLLPAPYGKIGRAHELKEDERTARPQDTADAVDSLHHAWNRAQREGAHDGIHAPVLQGNALPRQIQELDSQRRPAPLTFRKPEHPRIGFERVERAPSHGVL